MKILFILILLFFCNMNVTSITTYQVDFELKPGMEPVRITDET